MHLLPTSDGCWSSRAWNQSRPIYGLNNLDAAATMEDEGQLYLEEGKYGQAEAWFRQALAVRQSKLPSGNLLIAASLADQGQCLNLEDRNGEAEEALRRSANLYRVVGDPELVAVDNYLAQLLERTGSETEAIQFLRESVHISRQKYGLTSRYYANCLHNLGGALMGIGSYVEGERLTRQGADIRSKILPHDHPDRL